MVIKLSKQAIFEAIAEGTQVLWVLIFVVAAISIGVLISHLVPRREY